MDLLKSDSNNKLPSTQYLGKHQDKGAMAKKYLIKQNIDYSSNYRVTVSQVTEELFISHKQHKGCKRHSKPSSKGVS